MHVQEDNLFQALEDLFDDDSATNGDALERYLSTPTESVPDPIKYWGDRLAATPGLARMGLDYATIPGMCCLPM